MPVAGILVLIGIVLTSASCRESPAEASARLPGSRLGPGLSESQTELEIGLGACLFEAVVLSKDSTTSCATCHSPFRAFTEARPVSHGVGVRARRRNTPSLINVGLQATLDWDGRAATLEGQLRGVFSADGDMGMDLGAVVARIRSSRHLDEVFRRVYGRRADVEAVVGALAAFQRSLIVVESRFDRFYLGGDSTALSESEKRGWRLFRSVKAGCAGCHSPVPHPGSGVILFSEEGFHNLGVGYGSGRLEDVGRFGATHHPSDWGRFKTPSLRNVALTSPYMHDGSLATLEEVVDFYAAGGIQNPSIDVVMGQRKLTQSDRADLVAFLRSLTAEWLEDSVAVRERILVAAAQGLRC